MREGGSEAQRMYKVQDGTNVVSLTTFVGYLSCTRLISLSEVPGMLLK